MKADERERNGKGDGGGRLHWLGAQLCVGARPRLTCEPNYGMEGDGEAERSRGGGGGVVAELEGGWGGSHAQCEKGVARSCRGGGQSKQMGGGTEVALRSDCAGCFFFLSSPSSLPLSSQRVAAAAALNPSALWLGSHQIKKSLPHQSFTARL